MNGTPDNEGVEFSPDEKLLAIGDGTSGNILLWNIAADKVQAVLAEHGGNGGYVLSFSPDGKAMAAVAGPDGNVAVYVWDSAA
jgi:WD40 repeat protein